MKRWIMFLVVSSVLLVGSVTPAQAAPATRGQAVRMAKQYLEYQSFSQKGLAHQLRFEGFSPSEASYGASHAGANWNREAAESAKSYLDMQAFSRSGLIHQLRFEGYTLSQAVYGVRAAGL